jgi:hypothetical protein
MTLRCIIVDSHGFIAGTQNSITGIARFEARSLSMTVDVRSVCANIPNINNAYLNINCDTQSTKVSPPSIMIDSRNFNKYNS